MPIYDKPTWQLMRDFVKSHGEETFTQRDIKDWFRSHYPQINEKTVYLHTRRMTTNLPSRVNWVINPSRDDYFYKLQDGQLRLYDPLHDPQPIYKKSGTAKNNGNKSSEPPIYEPPDNGTDSTSLYLPNKEDFIFAYRKLTRFGHEISIDAVLDQIQIEFTNKGYHLEDNWRIITEKNIEIWSDSK